MSRTDESREGKIEGDPDIVFEAKVQLEQSDQRRLNPSKCNKAWVDSGAASNSVNPRRKISL